MLQLVKKSKASLTVLCLRGSTISRTYNDVSFEDIPEVSPALIKRVLKSQNVSFQEGFTCFIAQCLMCHKKSTPQTLYINKATGMYMCTSCKCNGSWDYIENRSRIKKKKGKPEEECINESQSLSKELAELRVQTAAVSNEKLLELLKKFKLPEVSSVINLDVRSDGDNLYFPLENADSEVVGYRKLTSNSDLVVPNITYGGLLTARPLKNRDTAVLVPSISDFLVLLDAKTGGSVVCLPNGVNNLSQYVLPSLERFKKLILWFGSDMKSWDSARHFAKKLGEKRCLFVRPSEKNLSPHLIPKQDYKAIISSAQPIWHKSITTFASLRGEVLSDLQNIDKVQGVKWKRFPTLSKILMGHRRGELTVITGPTGSGKTTFISEYSLDLAMQGVNTLWGSFEIRNARLARTMLQQLAGMPLDEHLHLFEGWADSFEQLPIYFMTFHGQQSIKVVMEAVEHATYVHDIAHVIIDNVQFMMGMTEEQRHMDRFWKQDVVVASFRSFATRNNCHVTLVIHPRKEKVDEDLTTSSIFGGAKASQEADNVLIIQDKRLTSVRGKKYLQIAKNRYSGDLGIMALEFDKQSLSFASKKATKKTSEEQIKTEST